MHADPKNRRVATLAPNWHHAGFRARTRRPADLVEILERARWLLALTHLLEQPDRLDTLPRVDVLVSGELLEDRDPVGAGQLGVRSFLHSDLRGGRWQLVVTLQTLPLRATHRR